MTYRVEKYTALHKTAWDGFIQTAVNGSFLWQRDFMEYHQNRFHDHSLLFYHNDNLVACLPAHADKQGLFSHRGLTYGGFALREHMNSPEFLQLLDVFLAYAREQAFAKAEIQLQASWYHPQHLLVSQGLKEKGFTRERTQHAMAVDLNKDVLISPKKTAGYRNGSFANLEIVKGDSLADFWQEVLIPALAHRHKTTPVHNLSEMLSLVQKFPSTIQQHNVYRDGVLLGGITFFLKNRVAKSQYAAATPEGMTTDAVAYLYMEAMKYFKKMGYQTLDFGPVNESDGSINKGLQRFKKQLGCEMEIVERLEVLL